MTITEDLANPAANEKAQVVLEAARKVFLQNGFSAATTDMIQREAGVSKSTVYAHYANKEALFAAVIESECAAFIRRVDELELGDMDLETRLRQLAVTYLGIVLSPRALAQYRVVSAEAPKFPELAHRFYQAGPQRLVAFITGVLARAAEAGELALGGLGADVAALAFTGIVRSDLRMHYVLHPDARPSSAQIERWAELSVQIFLQGFAPKA